MTDQNEGEDNCTDCGKPLGGTDHVCHECEPDEEEIARATAGYEPQETRNREGYVPPSPPEPEPEEPGKGLMAAAMGDSESPYASDDPVETEPSRSTETRVEMNEAILPFGQIDAVSQQERARHFRQNGGSVPSTEGLRDRLDETVENLIRHKDTRIVKSPTSLGKTYGIASKRWNAYDHITDDKRVYHLLPTREARDEAVEVAREHDVEMHVLKSGRELCPVCRGDYDPDKNDTTDITYNGIAASEIMRRMLDEVDKAIPFSKVHDWLDRNNDQNIDLPCQHDGECPAFEQYRVDREGEHGLTIATHSFAHVPNVVESKNVVIDEQPDFTTDIHMGVMRKSVTSYLDEVGCMVDTFEDLLRIGQSNDPKRELAELVAGEVTLTDMPAYQNIKKVAESEEDQRTLDVHTAASVEGLTVGEYKDAVWEKFLDELDRNPSDEWLFECENGHAKAQPFAKAVALLEEQPSGEYIGEVRYSPPRPDAHANDSSTWNRSVLRICVDSRNDVTQAWSVPDLRGARSVVGLDAHPQDPVWQVNTMSTMREKDPLTIKEESRWRRYERGLHTIQVGDATRPLASGEYFNWDYVRTLVETIYDQYGGEFRTALTTKAAAPKLKQIMEDAGCPDPEVMTYGMEKSRNDFANEDVGLVLGCLDPGDRMIMDYITALGYDARPERADVCCENCGDREEHPNEAGDG